MNNITLNIVLKNNKEMEYVLPQDATLAEVAQEIRDSDDIIVAAIVDNEIRELTYQPTKSAKVEFLTLSSLDGVRIYQRSLSFLFIRATMQCFNNARVIIEHSLSGGLFCKVIDDMPLSKKDYDTITDTMQKYIELAEPFVKELVSHNQAELIFKEQNMDTKAGILKYRQDEEISIYRMGDLADYFYGYMVPDASYIRCFELQPFNNGVILRHPTTVYPNSLPPFVKQPKLESVFQESEQWANIAGVDYVVKLNDMIADGRVFDLIKISEALHAKKIAQIADEICQKKRRLILIAGPSSSGKTTFANRLKIQLQVNGLRPVTISTDDYFVDRQFTPLDENGNYNFECIEAVDTELFNNNLLSLMRGEEVELPIFDFKEGKKNFGQKKMKIDVYQPIIIEGIHGLNEKLTSSIAKKDKFKIYISALTQLNIDDHNRIPTTDTRLIRRMVRDHRDRGHSAVKTIAMWHSVRKGEEQNIFPFQEQADAMFNSALPYELAVLKKYATPLLENIDEHVPEKVEAKRLLKFLNYFLSIEDESYIPYTSILKEFIG